MAWFNKSGNESDVVVSTRIRLARNIVGTPFPPRWSDEQAKSLTEKVKLAAGDEFDFLNLDNAPELNKSSLVEEHIISREMLGGKNKSLLLSKNGNASIMVGEEDHIRMQVIMPGFDVDTAYKAADALDDKLAASLDFAFDSQFGYLTHCTTNVGTGLRASVMLHLPAMRMVGRMNMLAGEVGKLGLTIRGLYGEGSEAKGDLYQLSNQITLGISENQACDKLKNVTLQIVNAERELRKKLADSQKSDIEDRIWRAFGTLKYARKLSSSECESLLSSIKLGINMGIIDCVSNETVTSLMIKAEPAHISLEIGRALTPDERDKVRAEMIRKELG